MISLILQGLWQVKKRFSDGFMVTRIKIPVTKLKLKYYSATTYARMIRLSLTSRITYGYHMTFRLGDTSLNIAVLLQFFHVVWYFWQFVGCLWCGMSRMWYVQYVGCTVYGMLGMWDVCWDMGSWFIKCIFEKLIFRYLSLCL